MKEQLIDFETAKLAKEKNFNWPVLFFYFKNFNAGLDYILVDSISSQFGEITKEEDYNNNNYTLERYSAPTQGLLQKWLREVHNIHLSIWYNNLTEKWRIDYIRNIKTDHDFTTNEDEFDTYELALEESLKQALNLIKNE